MPNEASEAVRFYNKLLDASKLLTQCSTAPSGVNKNSYTNCHSDDLFVGMSL